MHVVWCGHTHVPLFLLDDFVPAKMTRHPANGADEEMGPAGDEMGPVGQETGPVDEMGPVGVRGVFPTTPYAEHGADRVIQTDAVPERRHSGVDSTSCWVRSYFDSLLGVVITRCWVRSYFNSLLGVVID